MERPLEPQLLLFWCTTDDHHEDWFIVAQSAAQARDTHETLEGYNEGDATAEFVCEVPPDAPDRKPGWPSGRLLVACGAEFLSVPLTDHPVSQAVGQGGRVVRIGSKVYAEGDIVQAVLIEQGIAEPH